MQDTKSVLKSVKKIELKTKKLVDGLLTGAYHSIFKGRGIEFSQVREYNINDDYRTIDWNVSAKMNHPYVKEFIEERDLTLYILFDISGSSEFGSTKEKKETAIEISASLMFAGMKNNDNIGLALFTNNVEKFIKAKKGKRHVLKLIRDIIYYKPKEKTTDINKSLIYLSKIIKRKSIIFIISDFMSNDFIKPLKIMKKNHDIICINLKDIREEDIPDIGYIKLEDEETGEQILVNTSDKEFRKNYTELVKQKNEELKNNLKKINVDLIQLLSDKPFTIPIQKFFRIRQTKINR